MLKLSIPSGDGLKNDLTITSSTSDIPKNGQIRVRFLDKGDVSGLEGTTDDWDDNKVIFDDLFGKYYGAESGYTEDQKKMLLVRMACEAVAEAYNTGKTGKKLVETMFKHKVRIIANLGDIRFIQPKNWGDDSVILWNPIWHGVVTEGIPKEGDKKCVRGIMSPLLALIHEMGHAYQYLEQNHFFMLHEIHEKRHWDYSIPDGSLPNNEYLKFRMRGAYYEPEKNYFSAWLDEDNVKMNEFAAIEDINKYHKDNGRAAREPIRQEYRELGLCLWQKRGGQWHCDQSVLDDMNEMRTTVEALLPVGGKPGLFVSSNVVVKVVKSIWRFIARKSKKPKCVQDVKITDDWKGYFSFCKQIRDPHDKPTEEEKDKYCDFKERLDLEMDLYSKKAIYDKLLVIFRASNNGTYRRKGKKHLNDPELWYNAGSTWGAAMSKVVMEWEYLYQYMDNPPSPPPPPSLQKKKKFKVILDEYKKKRDEINSKAITIQNIEDAWKDSLKYVSSIITGEEILEKKWRPYQDTLQTIALHNINLHVDVGSNCDCQNMNVAAWTFASGKDVHLRPNAINKLVGGANCQWYLGVPSKHEMEDIIDSWGLTRSHLKSKEFQALIESLFAVERMMPLVEEAFNNIRAVGDLGEMLLRHDQRENVKFLVFPGAPGGMTPPKFAGPSGRNERGDNTGHSVIFWDPFSDFIFFAEDPDDDSKIYAERIPAWIVLGHELGHLRQFTMYPHWVKEVFKQTYDESKYPDVKQYGRDLDFPHNIQRYEHSLCDHGNFGKRQAYPAQNQAEFPGKALNREKSRDQLNARRTVSLIAWSNDPESPEDEAVRESVIDAARIIAKITQRITNHGDGFKLMERALSEDIYGSLKTQFRDLL